MRFRYCPEKNAKLLKERGIGFEEIIQEIHNDNVLDIVEHHNRVKYPNQKIMCVKCISQVYLVPYVIEKDGVYFLKTLYPSRKAFKKYIKI